MLAADVVIGPGAPPVMSATTVAILIMLAFVVDYMSIGPNSIRDRLAFFMACPAFRVGFADSPLSRSTTDLLGSWIDGVKQAADGSYFAQATTTKVVGAIVGILGLYCVGVLLPVRAQARLGGFARLAFSGGGSEFGGKGGGLAMRINWRLWGCAFFLGVLSDLPRGLIGGLLRGGIDAVGHVVSFLPDLLFGG